MSDETPYVVGIDLGTTHCAVAYVDTEVEEGEEGFQEVQVLEIPQLVRSGTVGEKALLPSFLYLPGEHEVSKEQGELPFDSEQTSLVGLFARDQGSKIPDRAVHSAGSQPGSLHPLAVRVMAEVGIDIAGHHSKPIEAVPTDRIGTVITLCAEEKCPVWLNEAERLHWPIPDPAGNGLEAFRAARDEIAGRLEVFFAERGLT